MEQEKNFTFEGLILGKLVFSPEVIESNLQYDASVIPEIDANNKNNTRITVKFELKDKSKEYSIFSIEDTGYFTITENFGSFNIDNKEEQEMVRIVIEDIKSLIYHLSQKSYDEPLDININVEDFAGQEKKYYE